MDFLKEHYTIADVEVNGIRHLKQVSVKADGYIIDDPKEIESLNQQVIKDIGIDSSDFDISFGKNSTSLRAYLYDDDIKVKGILVKIEEIISSTASPFLFFASHAFRWGIVGFVFMFGLFYELKTIEGSKSLPIRLTLIILPAVAISTLWLVRPSKFLFFVQKRKEKSSFWNRNRDRIIVGIITAIVTLILTLIGSVIIKEYL